MNQYIIGLYALALAAGAAVLPACSANGSASSSPLPNVRRAWVEPVPKSQALLYVSDIATNLVDIFTYPSGTKIRSLSGFGAIAGLCSDKAGDIFVVDEASPVQMFAHGGTSPIRKLTTRGAPYGCAMDPVTGNLALTNLSSYLYGALDIYPKAKGSPKQYETRSRSTPLTSARTMARVTCMSTAGTVRESSFSSSCPKAASRWVSRNLTSGRAVLPACSGTAPTLQWATKAPDSLAYDYESAREREPWRSSAAPT